MTSSSNGGSPRKKERSSSAESSDRDVNSPQTTSSHPPPHQPPHMDTTAHPPPPPTGYHGQQHAYPPQGYAWYPNGYPGGYYYPPPYQGYTQAPPAAYYASQAQAQQLHYHRSRTSGFLRGFILCSFIMFMLTFLAMLSMWLLVVRPHMPICKVDEFSVSDFNPSNSNNFTANWQAKITIENPNDNAKVRLTNVGMRVFFARVHALASDGKYLSGFDLEKKGRKQLEVNASSSPSSRYFEVDDRVLAEMSRQRSTTGWVDNIALRFSLETIFMPEDKSFTTTAGVVVVWCKGFKLQFQDTSSPNGTWKSSEGPVQCFIPLIDLI